MFLHQSLHIQPTGLGIRVDNGASGNLFCSLGFQRSHIPVHHQIQLVVVGAGYGSEWYLVLQVLTERHERLGRQITWNLVDGKGVCTWTGYSLEWT
jgi:hypothetical protein